MSRPMAVDPQPQDPLEERDPMPRLRVGVTGLAVVVLLVALCFAIASVVRRNVTEGNATIAAAAPGNASERDNEPLAQLGVAPTVADNGHAAKDGAR